MSTNSCTCPLALAARVVRLLVLLIVQLLLRTEHMFVCISGAFSERLLFSFAHLCNEQWEGSMRFNRRWSRSGVRTLLVKEKKNAAAWTLKRLLSEQSTSKQSYAQKDLCCVCNEWTTFEGYMANWMVMKRQRWRAGDDWRQLDVLQASGLSLNDVRQLTKKELN